MDTKRDISVDVVRGLAILTMVAANIAALILAEPHPFWFRLYGTFAAPLFIMMSGMMVVHTTRSKSRSFSYYAVRGGMVMIMGALVDMLIWKDWPFLNIDVLYLIGLSLPIAYLCSRLPLAAHWAVAALILAVTPLLQNVLGYADAPIEITVWGEVYRAENHVSILNHWLVDGWFPIFPWTAFAVFGSAFGRLRSRETLPVRMGTARGAAFVTGVLPVGAILWWQWPGDLLTRDGYSELFYPVTMGYAVTAVGVALLAFMAVDFNPGLRVYAPLQALGEASLFMYVIHLAIGEYILSPLLGTIALPRFLVVYTILMAVLIGLAYGLRKVRAVWKPRPFLVKFLIG